MGRWPVQGMCLVVAATACSRHADLPARTLDASVEAGAGDASLPEPEPTRADRDMTWEVPSRDAKVFLRQVHDVSGCRLECVQAPAQTLWKGTSCVGRWLDLRFISDDCERIVVLHPFPKAVPEERATPVAHVFKRDVQVQEVQAGGMVADWSKVRRSGSQFYWLQGVLDVPGRAPRYSADGTAVEMETIDGKPRTVSLIPSLDVSVPAPPPIHRKRHR